MRSVPEVIGRTYRVKCRRHLVEAYGQLNDTCPTFKRLNELAVRGGYGEIYEIEGAPYPFQPEDTIEELLAIGG